MEHGAEWQEMGIAVMVVSLVIAAILLIRIAQKVLVRSKDARKILDGSCQLERITLMWMCAMCLMGAFSWVLPLIFPRK